MRLGSPRPGSPSPRPIGVPSPRRRAYRRGKEIWGRGWMKTEDMTSPISVIPNTPKNMYIYHCVTTCAPKMKRSNSEPGFFHVLSWIRRRDREILQLNWEMQTMWSIWVCPKLGDPQNAKRVEQGGIRWNQCLSHPSSIFRPSFQQCQFSRRCRHLWEVSLTRIPIFQDENSQDPYLLSSNVLGQTQTHMSHIHMANPGHALCGNHLLRSLEWISKKNSRSNLGNKPSPVIFINIRESVSKSIKLYYN